MRSFLPVRVERLPPEGEQAPTSRNTRFQVWRARLSADKSTNSSTPDFSIF
jgi:hypothetical protein